jgi:hypothetical protein
MSTAKAFTLVRWSAFVLVMTAASWVPFSIIAMVSVLDNWWALLQYFIFIGAGLLQGALIGFGQALALRNTRISVPGRQWIAASSLGAGATWAVALIPGFFFAPDLKNIIVSSLAAAFIIFSVSLFPYVQTRVLRYRVRDSWRWIAITTASWLLGALVFGLFSVLIRGDVNLFVAIFTMTVGGTVALLGVTLVQGAGMRLLAKSTIANPRWGNILPDTPRVEAARARARTAQARAGVTANRAKRQATRVAKSATAKASDVAKRARRRK